MARRTLVLSDRKRRELARTLKDVRQLLDDPERLIERAAWLLRRRDEETLRLKLLEPSRAGGNRLILD